MKRKITELDDRLNPDGPGKKLGLKTKETLKKLRSDAKKCLYRERKYNQGNV